MGSKLSLKELRDCALDPGLSLLSNKHEFTFELILQLDWIKFKEWQSWFFFKASLKILLLKHEPGQIRPRRVQSLSRTVKRALDKVKCVHSWPSWTLVNGSQILSNTLLDKFGQCWTRSSRLQERSLSMVSRHKWIFNSNASRLLANFLLFRLKCALKTEISFSMKYNKDYKFLSIVPVLSFFLSFTFALYIIL